MASCVDWSTVTGPHTASTLCSKLSPSRPNAPCVSLKPFLEDPGDIERALLPEEDISTPCKINQCPPGQICIVEPNAKASYRCEAACSLGEMSRQLVPVKTWIQVRYLKTTIFSCFIKLTHLYRTIIFGKKKVAKIYRSRLRCRYRARTISVSAAWPVVTGYASARPAASRSVAT